MNRRKFLSYVGCGCYGLIMPSCTNAPITDRKQFKIIPENKLNAQAAQIYEKIKEKEKLSNDITTLNLIKDISFIIDDVKECKKLYQIKTSLGHYFINQNKINDYDSVIEETL